MQCHSDKHLEAMRLALAFAIAGAVLTHSHSLSAQISPQTVWGHPPPPVLWIGPPPTIVQHLVRVQPLPKVTTFSPPAPIIHTVEKPVVLPELDGHLRITVTEAFLARLLSRNDTVAGPVRECILGADVHGEQFTVTQTTVDLRPCLDKARFVLRLTGNVADRTVGVTPRAQLQSTGAHQFQMEKQVDFDGQSFTTRSPAAWVIPRISYRGATTFATGVPLVGDIARSIALSEAERQRPQAEQIASQMVTRQAAPRFNNEVDNKLAKANHQLSRLIPVLFDWIDLTPDRLSLRTSPDRLIYQLRLPRPAVTLGRNLYADVEDVSFDTVQGPLFLPADQHAPPVTLPEYVEGRAITVAVHEDLVNHVLDSLPLGGHEIPDTLIDRLIEILLQTIENRSFDPASRNLNDLSEAEFATVVLADDRPVSVRFDDGQVLVTALAGFRPKLTAEVPTQRVEFPYTISQSADNIMLLPGQVTVTATLADDSGPLAEIARPLIQQQVAQRLHEVTLPTSADLNLPEMTPTRLTVNQVVIEDSWLVITLD